VGDLDVDLPGDRVTIGDVGGGGPQEGEVGVGWEEHHSLGFIGICPEALVGKPGGYLFKALGGCAEGRPGSDAGREYGPIINVQLDGFIRPC
jgi:hypothetical protein